MPSPLFIDIYALDTQRPKGVDLEDWGKVVSDKAYAGAIIKATEGTYYTGGSWFQTNWPAIRNVAGYGRSWFRGAYHFLKFNQDGAKQADFYQKIIEQAGGWDRGDLWPIVDVELGGEKNSNQLADAAQVIRCTTDFAERMKQHTGRDVMLYGNGAMRDLQIKDRMGCRWLWCPRYTSTLPPHMYQRAGWETKDLWGWQYCGDGTGFLKGYPTISPLGKTDISVLTFPGGLDAMREALGHKKPEPKKRDLITAIREMMTPAEKEEVCK